MYRSCFTAQVSAPANTHPRQSALNICIAGKDRTGVAAGLLLALAGVPEGYICRDFALTRIGFEPARDLLTMKLTGGKPFDINDEEVKWKMETFGSAKYVRRIVVARNIANPLPERASWLRFSRTSRRSMAVCLPA